jgi:uncharacterized membrane protein YphA (DoxX/SURF4 family)
MLRVVAVVAFALAIFCFVIALVVNATTNPTAPQHWVDGAGIAIAAGLALLAAEGARVKPPA